MMIIIIIVVVVVIEVCDDISFNSYLSIFNLI